MVGRRILGEKPWWIDWRVALVILGFVLFVVGAVYLLDVVLADS